MNILWEDLEVTFGDLYKNTDQILDFIFYMKKYLIKINIDD